MALHDLHHEADDLVRRPLRGVDRYRILRLPERRDANGRKTDYEAVSRRMMAEIGRIASGDVDGDRRSRPTSGVMTVDAGGARNN